MFTLHLRKTKLELKLFESGALYGYINDPSLLNIVLNSIKHCCRYSRWLQWYFG